jgi:hypothetical protein
MEEKKDIAAQGALRAWHLAALGDVEVGAATAGGFDEGCALLVRPMAAMGLMAGLEQGSLEVERSKGRIDCWIMRSGAQHERS